MSKPKFSFFTAMAIVVAVVFGCLFYISVLGENNKANLAAQMFVDNIKNNNYSSLPNAYQAEHIEKFNDFEKLIKYHFSLELSLLKHFSLLEKDDYEVKIERENLWIPFFKTNDINLNISLREKKEVLSISNFFKKEKFEPLNNFFVFTRTNGDWKIKTINIDSSQINNDFAQFNKDLDLNEYIEISQDGFHIKDHTVNVAALPLTEKRILRLSLKKALEILK